MADDQILNNDEIERLLRQAAGGAVDASPPPDPPPSSAPVVAAAPPPIAVEPQAPTELEPSPALLAGEGAMTPGDVEYLLQQAQQALASVDAPSTDTPPGASAFHLEEFAGAPASTETATIDLIRDVELDLRIELGRTHMYLEDVLKLRKGSVVPLDKLAGDPVDVYVNGRLVARGEVLVLNDNFCVRVAELITGAGV